MMVNMMNDEMDEQTEDLMQAQKEEIAALDDGIQALCQRRKRSSSLTQRCWRNTNQATAERTTRKLYSP
jgi:hypothetical protein